MAVSATIQVSFGTESGADGHLSAEIDARATGLNDGDTDFAPGDTAYFLVFKSTNVEYDTPVASAGTLVSGTISGGYVEREEDLSFADTHQASLSVPASQVVSYEWFGRSLGDLNLLEDAMTLEASASGVAVCRVKYRAPCTAHGIASPASLNGKTDYSILVFIRGRVVSG
jgi:hypothetical protein